MSRLLVLPADRISDWINKGEVLERYWNPGDVFDRIDVATMFAAEDADTEALQLMAGRADVALHRIDMPERLFRTTLGFRPWLLRGWARQAVALARRLTPDVVRCHGAGLNAFAAREIRRELGIPYAVSVHINPDEDVTNRAATRGDRLSYRALDAVARAGLRDADLVLPVYEPIVPYLERMGVTRYEVAYNVIAGDDLRIKADYALHDPVRIISVGRLFAAKDPSNLIRALDGMQGVELTVVGDGPLRPSLQELAGPNVRFRPAIPNAELCALLAEHDIFATHSEHWEIAKAIIEPLLTGLPVVLNRRMGAPVPELQGGIVELVDDTPESWRAALERLIADHAAREELGRHGRAVASERWSPERTEAHFAAIYRRLLGESPRIPSAA